MWGAGRGQLGGPGGDCGRAAARDRRWPPGAGEHVAAAGGAALPGQARPRGPLAEDMEEEGKKGKKVSLQSASARKAEPRREPRPRRAEGGGAGAGRGRGSGDMGGSSGLPVGRPVRGVESLAWEVRVGEF